MTVSIAWWEFWVLGCGDDDGILDNLEYFLWRTMMARKRTRHKKEAQRMAWWRRVLVELPASSSFILLESSSKCRISLMALSPSLIFSRNPSCSILASESICIRRYCGCWNFSAVVVVAVAQVYEWLDPTLGFTWLWLWPVRSGWWPEPEPHLLSAIVPSQQLCGQTTRTPVQPISFISF